jgi:hypothetical protein
MHYNHCQIKDFDPEKVPKSTMAGLEARSNWISGCGKLREAGAGGLGLHRNPIRGNGLQNLKSGQLHRMQ